MTTHFHMIDYIHENGEALRRTLEDNEQAVLEIADRIQAEGFERLVISGIGSSYTAAVMAAPIFRSYSQLPVHIIPSTDTDIYLDRLIDSKTVVIVISRSGERDWVVNALKKSAGRGAFAVAMTGVADSLLAQNAHLTLVTGEGPEISFPKTKSVVSCAGLLMRLALALAAPGDQGALDLLEELRRMPAAIERSVATAEAGVQALIPWISGHEVLCVCGTASNYGTAQEAAVKVQEAAYVTTLCDDTGNLLHGPLGPLNERWLVVPLVGAFDRQLSLELLEVTRKLGAHSLAIAGPELDLESASDQVLELPDSVDPLLAALVYLPPIQLITYYWALARQRNPDKPDFSELILEAILPEGRVEPHFGSGG
jgi:glutamine---fructose-6-phosphate transaminase (isomerizing)